MANGIAVSHEWTPFDRLGVIGMIGAQMADATRASGGLHRGREVFSWAERICFVAQFDAAFLEANRAQILDGIAVREGAGPWNPPSASRCQ